MLELLNSIKPLNGLQRTQPYTTILCILYTSSLPGISRILCHHKLAITCLCLREAYFCCIAAAKVVFFFLVDPRYLCYSFCNPCSHRKWGAFEFEGWEHFWLSMMNKHIRIGRFIPTLLREIHSHQLPQQVWGGICGPKVWARREICAQNWWALKSWCCSKILWNFASWFSCFNRKSPRCNSICNFIIMNFAWFCKYVSYLNLN